MRATALEALDGADAAVLVTEWPEFGELDWEGEVLERMATPLIVDGRNFLDAGAAARRRLHLRGRGPLVQALVLAGGVGTRLRPLTSTVPKPVLPLAGRPFLSFLLDWLIRHGVDDVVLSCGFLADAVREVLGERHRGVPLRYVNEEEPLGTAGPVRLAAEHGVLAERFVVMNGDILTDADLAALVAGHERSGAVATVGLVEVEDTTSYGVVPTGEDGEVEAFLEKSDAPAPTNRVNAGVYVLEREIVDDIPAGRAASFEREVFPSRVGRGLFGRHLTGYWMDIGTPERYLEATYDLLAGVVESDLPPRDQSGSLVSASSITSGARIGPQSVRRAALLGRRRVRGRARGAPRPASPSATTAWSARASWRRALGSATACGSSPAPWWAAAHRFRRRR